MIFRTCRNRFLFFAPWLSLCGCFGSGGNGDFSTNEGKTLFVNQVNNTGKADGSETNPYISIQDALDTLVGGEVIRVAPGTYEEDLVVPFNVEIVGTQASSTILNGSGSAPLFVLDAEVDSFAVEGFTLRNGFSRNGAVVDANDVDLRFLDCLFQSNATGDDSAGSESFNAAVVFCQNGSRLLIQRCVFLDNATSGIALIEPLSATVQNTVLAMLDGFGVVLVGSGDTQQDEVLLSNLTIYGTSDIGIRISKFGDAAIRNVILSNSPTSLFETQFAGDPLMFYCNLQNGYRDIDTDQRLDSAAEINALDPPAVNVGNLAEDPLFTDGANGNFQLLSNSPCVDAGDPAILDADGSRSDMGAFGGPEGDFDSSFRTPLSGNFARSSSTASNLKHILDAAPDIASSQTEHTTDLDADGRPDQLRLVGKQLQWWVNRRGHGERPAPLPPGLFDIVRATTFDVDGDGLLDLVVEDRNGQTDFHRSVAQERTRRPLKPQREASH